MNNGRVRAVPEKNMMGILVVKIKQKTQNICIISGYGRQQNWPGDKRRSCFVALETEVETANLHSCPASL